MIIPVFILYLLIIKENTENRWKNNPNPIVSQVPFLGNRYERINYKVESDSLNNPSTYTGYVILSEKGYNEIYEAYDWLSPSTQKPDKQYFEEIYRYLEVEENDYYKPNEDRWMKHLDLLNQDNQISKRGQAEFFLQFEGRILMFQIIAGR